MKDCMLGHAPSALEMFKAESLWRQTAHLYPLGVPNRVREEFALHEALADEARTSENTTAVFAAHMTAGDFSAVQTRVRGGEHCRFESETATRLRPYIEALGKSFEEGRAEQASGELPF